MPHSFATLAATPSDYASAVRERELTKLRLDHAHACLRLQDALAQGTNGTGFDSFAPASTITLLYGQWYKARTQLDAALVKTGGRK